MKTFTQFLEDKCWQIFPLTLDDDMPDTFDSFMSTMDIDTMHEYAEEYGREMYEEGRENGLLANIQDE